VGESKWWAVLLGVVGVVSLYWVGYGRGGTGGEFGGFVDRWEYLVDLCLHRDRLAASLAIDACVFWVFQSWLIPDDMKARGYSDQTVLWIARVVPFFGVLIYLLKRPSLNSNQRE